MTQKELLSRIKQWLIAENFQAGSRLPREVELAELFGVSRSSIREVVIHLCFLGILKRSTKRGTILCTPGCNDIGENLAFQLQIAGCGFEELKQARLFLETSQVPLLLQKITPAMLDHLQELTAQMESLASSPMEADRLDLQFHMELMKISGNRILETFSQLMILLFDRKYRTRFLNAAAVHKSVRDHRAMLEAISANNKKELIKIIQDHIRPI